MGLVTYSSTYIQDTPDVATDPRALAKKDGLLQSTEMYDKVFQEIKELISEMPALGILIPLKMLHYR